MLHNYGNTAIITTIIYAVSNSHSYFSNCYAVYSFYCFKVEAKW